MIDFLFRFHPITTGAVVIFALALWKGGLPERLGAAMMIAEWLVELVVDSIQSANIATTPTVFCDFILACGLLGIGIRFGRLWLGVAMILQAITLAMHALALGDDAPGYNLYAAVLNVTTVLMLLSLLAGSISAWSRRVRRRRSRLRPAPQLLAAA